MPMGITITASHNKHTDNGIKIAGVKGESIDSEWENIFTVIINSKNLSQDMKAIIIKINQICRKNKYFFRDYTPVLNIAYDTRKSSEGLNKILTDCLKIYEAKYFVYGVLTTPALQYLTLLNQMAFKKVNSVLSQFSFTNVSEYWNFLGGIYFTFNTFYDQFYKSQIQNITNYETELLVDCANGAAGYHYENINKIFNNKIKLKFINTNYKNYEFLNSQCGAEHVHKEKTLPINYPIELEISKNVSFDGDVDRIIYL
jgi:phosphoacetylglucosamine mutase